MKQFFKQLQLSPSQIITATSIFIINTTEVQISNFVIDKLLYTLNALQSMKKIIFVSLLTVVVLTLCEDLTISARYPCIYRFTLNGGTNKCDFASVESQLQGSQQVISDWTLGFFTCCPGFVTPKGTTLDDLQPCIEEFNNSQPLVIIAGVMIGVVIFLVFVVLPCCINRNCPVYQCRMKIFKYFFGEEVDELQKLREARKKQSMVEDAPPSQNVLMAFQTLSKFLAEQKIDNDYDPQSNCSMCKKEQPTIRLKCEHYFHIYCLTEESKNKKIRVCKFCKIKNIMPIRIYCSRCFRVYLEDNNITSQSSYVCRSCNGFEN